MTWTVQSFDLHLWEILLCFIKKNVFFGQSDVLKTLLDIAANTQERPNQYLSFPVTSKSNLPLFYKEDYFKQKSNSSAPSGDVSKTSPLHISLDHILPWPPYNSKGFSVSVWIRIEELPKKSVSLKRTKTWSSERRTSRGKDSSKRENFQCTSGLSSCFL